MRFLIDANLPPALARWLAEDAGHEAIHVGTVGLEGALDCELWQRAREMGVCIVTKDEDFVLLHAVDRRGPPVVWIRMGNASRAALLLRLAPLWPGIVAALERGEMVIEVR